MNKKFAADQRIYYVDIAYRWRQESDITFVGGGYSTSLFEAMNKCYQEVINTPTWDYNDEYILYIKSYIPEDYKNTQEEIRLMALDHIQNVK